MDWLVVIAMVVANLYAVYLVQASLLKMLSHLTEQLVMVAGAYNEHEHPINQSPTTSGEPNKKLTVYRNGRREEIRVDGKEGYQDPGALH